MTADLRRLEQCGITIQSADHDPLFTVVISGLFTSSASFSLAHEYLTRNQNMWSKAFDTLRKPGSRQVAILAVNMKLPWHWHTVTLYIISLVLQHCGRYEACGVH